MTHSNIEAQLNKLVVPEIHTREVLSQFIGSALLAEVQADAPFVGALREIVTSTEFQELIQSGKITFGMVKPSLPEDVFPEHANKSDAVLADEIISKIQSPLRVLYTFSFVMTTEFIEEFYRDPKARQLGIAPVDPHRYGGNYKNRWEEFVELFKRGPVTGIILYEESGNAVPEWRSQMGKTWNVFQARIDSPDSIRALYGKDNHNNIVHGSDSIESVRRELDLVTHLY